MSWKIDSIIYEPDPNLRNNPDLEIRKLRIPINGGNWDYGASTWEQVTTRQFSQVSPRAVTTGLHSVGSNSSHPMHVPRLKWDWKLNESGRGYYPSIDLRRALILHSKIGRGNFDPDDNSKLLTYIWYEGSDLIPQLWVMQPYCTISSGNKVVNSFNSLGAILYVSSVPITSQALLINQVNQSGSLEYRDTPERKIIITGRDNVNEEILGLLSSTNYEFQNVRIGGWDLNDFSLQFKPTWFSFYRKYERYSNPLHNSIFTEGLIFQSFQRRVRRELVTYQIPYIIRRFFIGANVGVNLRLTLEKGRYAFNNSDILLVAAMDLDPLSQMPNMRIVGDVF